MKKNKNNDNICKTLFKIVKILYQTIKYIIKIIFEVNIKKIQSQERYQDFLRNWSKDILKTANIKIEVYGLENINPKETNYIYISNHSSLLDIPIFVTAIPDFIHFIYKAELSKIPLFGSIIKKMQFIPIERDNPKKAKQSMEKAAYMINKIGSVILFPEGRRSRTGEVGKFKRGAFLLASKTKKNIVPIAICGSEKILPANTFKLKSGKVKVFIFPVIENIPEERLEMQKEIENINVIIAEKVIKMKKNFDIT